MFEISTFLGNMIAQELCGGVDLVKATSFTYKLFSDVVDLEGVGTELTVPEYEQFVLPNNLTTFPARIDMSAVNAAEYQSADVFSEDATYQSIGVFDHLGNLWFRKVVTRTITAGQFQVLEASDFELTVG